MNVCPYCGWEIDTEVCWCGAAMSPGWHDGHNAVSLGCTCGFYEADKMKNPNYEGCDDNTAGISNHRAQ